MTTVLEPLGPPSGSYDDLEPLLWRDLTWELDAWATAGQTATLWWRDDDATRPTPALARLRQLAQDNGIPVALAVVPAGAQICVLFASANDDPRSASTPIALYRRTGEARSTLSSPGCSASGTGPPFRR